MAPSLTPGKCKQHLHRQSASNIFDCMVTPFLLSGERKSPADATQPGSQLADCMNGRDAQNVAICKELTMSDMQVGGGDRARRDCM